MEISLPYGRTQLRIELPDDRQVDILAPEPVPAAPHPLRLVEEALAKPCGGASLPDLVSACPPGSKVAIAINDKTRPVPHQHLLPPLLEKLAACGVRPADITFIIATGTHPPMTQDEFSKVIPPDIAQGFRVVSHDAEGDLVWMGETPRGTPVWVNREYTGAQIRIVVGSIEPHQFVGFSGGVKTAAIGLCGVETITRNHTRMSDPASRLGDYETNPARQDVEDIGERIGVHFALNAVLNDHKEIVHVLAGAPRSVMQAGLPLSRQVCQVQAPGEYDLLIASPGGHPKDINLYQAQKALAHAALVTRTGGTVIVAAACPEGSGSSHYDAWMQDKQTYAQIIAAFEAQGFRIGPHKAFQIARDASRVKLLFYSDMDAALADAYLLNPVTDLAGAVREAVAGLPPSARIGVMPSAASTIPFLDPQAEAR